MHIWQCFGWTLIFNKNMVEVAFIYAKPGEGGENNETFSSPTLSLSSYSPIFSSGVNPWEKTAEHLPRVKIAKLQSLNNCPGGFLKRNMCLSSSLSRLLLLGTLFF